MKRSHDSYVYIILPLLLQQDAKRTEEHNVVILVDFAIALMQTLDTINRESFQRFRLRMGLNHGPVIAGVIGKWKDEQRQLNELSVSPATNPFLLNSTYEIQHTRPDSSLPFIYEFSFLLFLSFSNPPQQVLRNRNTISGLIRVSTYSAQSKLDSNKW